MSLRLAAFALWCLGVLTGCAYASYAAWSPFSDEEKPQHASGFYGPTHK